jgi:hypothetical protein
MHGSVVCCRVCCGARECDELVVCSHCPTAFCKTCLARALGDEGLETVMNEGIGRGAAISRPCYSASMVRMRCPSLSSLVSCRLLGTEHGSYQFDW